MKFRPAVGGGIAIAGLSIIVPACGGDLPHDHGEVWECTGTASDKDLQGNDQIIAFIGPGQVEVTECANPGVPQKDIIDACKDDCESKFRAWGLFDEFPFIYHDITGCSIHGVTPTGRPCHDPVEPLNGGPANARIAIEQAASTVDVNIKGHGGHGNAFGTLDITIDPFCAASSCKLFISRFDLGVTSFDLDGHTVHDVDVQNAGTVSGTWQSDTSFELPPASLGVSAVFRIDDDDDGSTTLVNSANSLHGNLAKDYGTFTLVGDFDDGNGSSVHLNLSGTAIARPPVARFTPTGAIQCDAPPAVAHVTLDSSTSSDPDGDILHRGWKVDGNIEGLDAVTLPEVLSLGSHSVALDVVDSRAGVDEARSEVTVVDTVPPSLTAALLPTCLWPPSHDLVLYTFDDGIDASSTDVCDAQPTVRVVDVVSNQAALGGGSGDTTPDVFFGSGAFCVRAERDGTQNVDRVYTVTLEAIDSVGNVTQKQVTVRVPHDLGQGIRPQCPNIDPARVVADGDPRCTRAAAEPRTSPVAPARTAEVPLRVRSREDAPRACSVGAVGAGHLELSYLGFGAALVLGGALRRRRPRGSASSSLAMLAVATTTALAVLGCGKDDSAAPTIAGGPLSGAVHGNPVTISGTRAQWRPDRTRMTVMLSSYSAACGAAAATPANGQTMTEIDVTVPQGKAQPGTYPVSVDLSPGATNVGIGITQYTADAQGKLQQSTVYAQGGTLRIDSVDGTHVQGGLAVDQSGVTLSGTFTATICP